MSTSIYVDAESMLYLSDVQRKVITVRHEYVFVRYAKRKNVFNAVKMPKEREGVDLLEAICSVYPEVPRDSWHVEKKFVVLRNPMDLLLLELSY